MRWISEEFVFSGAHRCNYHIHGYSLFLMEMAWIFGTAWEVLTVCLAVWSAVRYFRELQRPSTGWTVENYCMILLKTHVFYFLRWACKLIIFTLPCLSSTLVSLFSHPFTSCISLRSWYATSYYCLHLHLKFWIFLIILIARLTLHWGWDSAGDLWWYSYYCGRRADVYTRTAPHPWYSRISCQACSQLWRRKWVGFNGFPGLHTHFNWRQCVTLETPAIAICESLCT